VPGIDQTFAKRIGDEMSAVIIELPNLSDIRLKEALASVLRADTHASANRIIVIRHINQELLELPLYSDEYMEINEELVSYMRSGLAEKVLSSIIAMAELNGATMPVDIAYAQLGKIDTIAQAHIDMMLDINEIAQDVAIEHVSAILAKKRKKV